MKFFGDTKGMATNTSKVQASRKYNYNEDHENLSNDSLINIQNNKNLQDFYKIIKIESKSF